jgi:hypothetical protein
MSEEKEGWVYCISNEFMPGLLKIGMTDRTPQDRLAEANRSDTWRPPADYVIEFAKKVKNPLKKEKTIHKLLEEYNERVNSSREFFRITKIKARLYFDLMDGDYWEPPPLSAPKEKTKKGGQRKKKNQMVETDENPSNPVGNTTEEPLVKEINKEINQLLSNKIFNIFETIFNSNVIDLDAEESKKLLQTAFDKASLDIKLKSGYYIFEELKKIPEKQLKNKIFIAILSSPSNPDMIITNKNIDSVINQIKYKTDTTFVLLTEKCKM